MIFFFIYWLISMCVLVIKYFTVFWSCMGVWYSGVYTFDYVVNLVVTSAKNLITDELLSFKKGKFSEIEIEDFTLHKKGESFVITQKQDDVERTLISLKGAGMNTSNTSNTTNTTNTSNTMNTANTVNTINTVNVKNIKNIKNVRNIRNYKNKKKIKSETKSEKK